MWSAACGQAAKDQVSFRLPRRRREAPLELRVLARPLLEVRRARPRALLGLGLERVLLAGVLCVTGGFVASGGSLRRRRAGARGENSRRASGALAASRDVFVSLDKFQASRSESGHLAALVVVHNPRSAWRPPYGAVFLVAGDSEISQAAP